MALLKKKEIIQSKGRARIDFDPSVLVTWICEPTVSGAYFELRSLDSRYRDEPLEIGPFGYVENLPGSLFGSKVQNGLARNRNPLHLDSV